VADILTSDLTTGTDSLTGDGVFDELMRAFEAHIHREFSERRIIGSEYTQVYLGGMQSAMQTAVTFLLGKQNADKQADMSAAQALLLLQKVETEKAQTEDTVLAGAVVGAVGNQNAVLAAQTTAFTRDAEQKTLKILADSYAVRRSTNSAEIVPPGLDNADISLVSQKAAAGIGVVLDIGV